MKNNRTFLEKLLDGAEVEWKPLIKVASLTRGRVISKEYLANNLGDYPVYSSQTVNNGEIGKINSFDFDGEFVSWTTDGANAGTVFYRSGKFSITNVCGLIKIQNNLELNYKFLFYWLSIEAKNHVYSGMGNPKLMSHQMEKILIPIPPLSVQTEIVKILDALTALTSELTSELILRQKQYEYYREKLLSEEELGKVGFEWKPLGEVTNIKTGQAVSKYSISQNPGIYPVINSGREPLGFINEWNTENDPIGITTRGAGVGSITWQEGKYFRGNLNYSVTVKSDYKLNIRFLYHILLHFQKEIHNLCSFTGIPALNASELKKLEISIPAIEEQQRIVSILDKFETLTNSITEGLPLAIEQSQKRYEYYRELLLNFPGRE
ncbi:TPA: restriction endonuclease subunit S [Haemophilus influenzae]|uniref:restriction endonuclease subunit S n=1 Tax=Haemophilus influenzae TaxID=727 RepID=UPI000667283E|nr:restriction endonuclease subunit S [Haemophilus influenzae]AXP45844.1 restriction endonuclease subunit S [Haemophilus influenzae]AXP64694.1 restriction endonuclease subunit S [Haemophilus influenzae]KMZ14027.1 restriction endonuclease subunit S [Haemophilus influenzae]KMZ18837.1 restriction endonuclease subunit S [Haemophilus influenzae]KMZ29608.1 restriction endonuclease subunit S [Haemophilus influenzae]